jgi:hypothetical protein
VECTSLTASCRRLGAIAIITAHMKEKMESFDLH